MNLCLTRTFQMKSVLRSWTLQINKETTSLNFAHRCAYLLTQGHSHTCCHPLTHFLKYSTLRMMHVCVCMRPFYMPAGYRVSNSKYVFLLVSSDTALAGCSGGFQQWGLKPSSHHCELNICVRGAHSLTISLCLSAAGCDKTRHGVTLQEWNDPLDPDLESQLIFRHLLGVREAMR